MTLRPGLKGWVGLSQMDKGWWGCQVEGQRAAYWRSVGQVHGAQCMCGTHTNAPQNLENCGRLWQHGAWCPRGPQAKPPTPTCRLPAEPSSGRRLSDSMPSHGQPQLSCEGIPSTCPQTRSTAKNRPKRIQVQARYRPAQPQVLRRTELLVYGHKNAD